MEKLPILCKKSICGYLPLMDLENYYQSFNQQIDVRLLTAYLDKIKQAEKYLPAKPGQMNMILKCEECQKFEAISYKYATDDTNLVSWNNNYGTCSDDFLCKQCSLQYQTRCDLCPWQLTKDTPVFILTSLTDPREYTICGDCRQDLDPSDWVDDEGNTI